MILIPQRLFNSSQVTTLLRDGNVCILKKELNEAIIKREGYISNHVIVILLDGKQQLKNYDEEVINVVAQEVLFIPRGMYYVSDFLPKNGTFKSLLFYFDDTIIQEFLATSKVTEIDKKETPSHLKFGIISPIQFYAKSLINIYSINRLRNNNFINLKILELLHLLNGLVPEQQFANFLFRLTLPQKRNIKTFMDNNFLKPLKIEDYAYLTGRSLSTFRRDFIAYYGITPKQWLTDRRLHRAIEILEKKEVSVGDLAYAIGYENVSYFIKAFKNKVGQSPKQYMLDRHRNHLN
ncbi:MAG: helix-turn-helix transcriptional regulator [Saprospiraceae bacterium]